MSAISNFVTALANRGRATFETALYARGVQTEHYAGVYVCLFIYFSKGLLAKDIRKEMHSI